MPTICRFAGILIQMYFDDHGPPHFHAIRGKQRIKINIATLEIMSGTLSPKALSLVLKWARANQLGLLRNWRRAERHLPLFPLDPLE